MRRKYKNLFFSFSNEKTIYFHLVGLQVGDCVIAHKISKSNSSFLFMIILALYLYFFYIYRFYIDTMNVIYMIPLMAKHKISESTAFEWFLVSLSVALKRML